MVARLQDSRSERAEVARRNALAYRRRGTGLELLPVLVRTDSISAGGERVMADERVSDAILNKVIKQNWPPTFQQMSRELIAWRQAAKYLQHLPECDSLTTFIPGLNYDSRMADCNCGYDQL